MRLFIAAWAALLVALPCTFLLTDETGEQVDLTTVVGCHQ